MIYHSIQKPKKQTISRFPPKYFRIIFPAGTCFPVILTKHLYYLFFAEIIPEQLDLGE